MGVCCIVFDIDWMLIEFCMNFLNIEKNIFSKYFFSHFMFSSRFMLFSTFVEKNKFRGGGGGESEPKNFFLCYVLHLHFFGEY